METHNFLQLTSFVLFYVVKKRYEKLGNEKNVNKNVRKKKSEDQTGSENVSCLAYSTCIFRIRYLTWTNNRYNGNMFPDCTLIYYFHKQQELTKLYVLYRLLYLNLIIIQNRKKN